jgi:hypothetical protein
MKPMYLNDLDVRLVQGGYKVLAPFKYISMVGGERLIIVPEDFITNFASIPRPFRLLITGHGQDRWAATIHDYLYSKKYDRAYADAVFLEALKLSKVNWFIRHAMHKAVRVGGWAFH